MLEQNLARVLDLVKKTGDRVIVFNKQGEPYVLMSIGEYERLATRSESVADLTEDQLLDKINRDISVWKTKEQDNAEAVSWSDDEEEFAGRSEIIEEKMKKSGLGQLASE